jgi:hypothetical protein
MPQSRRRSDWCQGLCSDLNSYLVGVMGLLRQCYVAEKIEAFGRRQGQVKDLGKMRSLADNFQTDEVVILGK